MAAWTIVHDFVTVSLSSSAYSMVLSIRWIWLGVILAPVSSKLVSPSFRPPE